jgi:hypothetical protein
LGYRQQLGESLGPLRHLLDELGDAGVRFFTLPQSPELLPQKLDLGEQARVLRLLTSEGRLADGGAADEHVQRPVERIEAQPADPAGQGIEAAADVDGVSSYEDAGGRAQAQHDAIASSTRRSSASPVSSPISTENGPHRTTRGVALVAEGLTNSTKRSGCAAGSCRPKFNRHALSDRASMP